MNDDDYLTGLREIEQAFNQQYSKAQIQVFKKHLNDIPARDWDGVVRQVIRTAKRLPSIADFFEARRELYTV